MISEGWLAAVVCVAIATASAVAYLSSRRGVPMATGLTVTSLGATGRLVQALLELGLGHGPVLHALADGFSILVVVGWVYFIAHYTDNERFVEDGRIYMVAAPLVVVTALLWARAALIFSGEAAGSFPVDVGLLHGTYTLYSYLLTFLTIGVLVARGVAERPIHRRQTAILAVAPLPPAFIGLAYQLGFVELTVDLTPVGYAITTLLALYVLRTYDLLEIVPLARETTVNNIGDAVIAVTHDGVIASVNDPGKQMLYVTDAVVGRDLADGLAGWPAIVDAVRNGDETQVRVDDTHVKISLTPIESRGGRLGTVVQLKDVTEGVERREKLREKQAELERKNEQLDEFASVVSHDIRTPLTVAKGHLDILESEVEDTDSIERIADAHDRIENIVDDLLTLAREGRQTAELTNVDFVRLARRARDTTAVPAEGFDCHGPSTVVADPSRLQQLLENLFHNSVQHAGADVAVTVGPLADEAGFYVEDDGPGIPEADREKAFEYGYTDSDDGTGFGLNIVETIADAHDWSVRVVEGTDGGARFEFTTSNTETGGRTIAGEAGELRSP